MFIKIQTLYPIFHGEFADVEWKTDKAAVINTDKIIDIQSSGNNYLIDLGGEKQYTISPVEYTRVEALLLEESPSLNHEASPTDAYLQGRLHGYDKAFAEGADWQKTQPTTLTLTERVTLFTLLHAHLNADQPQNAREMIANSIADFVEGKQRDRYAHMGLMSVLKEFGASAKETPSAEERADFQKKVDAAFDEAENYFYPAGPDDTPHCKTCGADLLYCRCKHTDAS